MDHYFSEGLVLAHQIIFFIGGLAHESAANKGTIVIIALYVGLHMGNKRNATQPL